MSERAPTKRSKPKKWESYRGKFPKLPPKSDDPKFEERVALMVGDILANQTDNTELCKAIANFKEKKEEKEAELSELNAELEARYRILAERFENNEIQKMSLSFATFYLNEEPYSSIEDKDALREWVVENGMQELLSINWGTLNSLVKGLIEDGKPEPSGVKVYLKTSVRMRRN